MTYEPIRDLVIGRLALPTVEAPVAEQLGSEVATTGDATAVGQRRVKGFTLTFPIHGDRADPDPWAVGMRMRRQLRSMMQNHLYRLGAIYVQFAFDPERNGWIVMATGNLADADGGVVLAEFTLTLDQAYYTGAIRTHREGFIQSLLDRRLADSPIDVEGDVVGGGVGFAALSPLSLVTLPVDANDAESLGVPLASGYRPGREGPLVVVSGIGDGYPVTFQRPEAAFNLGDVVAIDRRGNVGPFAAYVAGVLADGVLGLWRLDENPQAQTITPTAYDQTGRYPGAYQGTQTKNLIAVPLTSSVLTGWMTGAVAPTGFAGSPTTGGSLTGNNFCAVITALGAWGESLASTEIAIPMGANSAIAFSWTAYAGATSYNIYIGDEGTTVASGSNGVNVNTFTGSGALSVAAVEDYFPTAGTFYVQTSGGIATVTYTGVNPSTSQFTGCTFVSGSAGTMSTGGAVILVGTESAYANVTGTSYTMTALPGPEGTAPGSWLVEPGATLSTATSPAPQYGSAEAEVVTTSAQAKEGIFYRVPGTGVVTVSLYLRGSAGGETVSVIVGSSSLDHVSTNVTLTTAWQRVTLTWATQSFPETPGFVSVVTQTAAVRTLFVNAVQASLGPTVLPYSDTQSVELGQTGALVYSGDADNAVLLDGDSGCVLVPYAVALNPPVFSAEVWAKLTALQASAAYLMATALGGGVEGFLLGVTGGALSASVGNGASMTTLSAGTLSVGEWALVTLTYDGATMRLYVNGVLLGSAAAAYVPAANPLSIGALPDRTACVAATLDEAAVYGVTLSEAQVALRYNTAIGNATYDTEAGPLDPQTAYGWEEAYGPDYAWSWV